jgi:hypothetical protein
MSRTHGRKRAYKCLVGKSERKRPLSRYKHRWKDIIKKKFWKELIAYFPWYDTGHIENDASNNSSIVACVFVTAVKFLPTRCLAKIRGFLPRRCIGTIRGFLPSRCLATIRGFLPSRCLATIRGFLTSRCLATIGGYTHTQTEQRDLVSRLKMGLRVIGWGGYVLDWSGSG